MTEETKESVVKVVLVFGGDIILMSPMALIDNDGDTFSKSHGRIIQYK